MKKEELDELDYLWERYCRGCKNMSCNNSYKEIAKCKGWRERV